MRVWLLHGVAALMLALFFSSLPDCRRTEMTVKVVNESIYALTSVKLAPYSEDEEDQAAALDAVRNLLPVDAEGYTISLDSGRTSSTFVKFQDDVVIGAVTFFVDGVYQEYVQYVPIDLSEVPEGAVLIMRVVRDDVNAAQIYFEYE